MDCSKTLQHGLPSLSNGSSSCFHQTSPQCLSPPSAGKEQPHSVGTRGERSSPSQGRLAVCGERTESPPPLALESCTDGGKEYTEKRLCLELSLAEMFAFADDVRISKNVSKGSCFVGGATEPVFPSDGYVPAIVKADGERESLPSTERRNAADACSSKLRSFGARLLRVLRVLRSCWLRVFSSHQKWRANRSVRRKARSPSRTDSEAPGTSSSSSAGDKSFRRMSSILEPVTGRAWSANLFDEENFPIRGTLLRKLEALPEKTTSTSSVSP